MISKGLLTWLTNGGYLWYERYSRPLAYDKQGGGQFLGNGNNLGDHGDATAQAIDKGKRFS